MVVSLKEATQSRLQLVEDRKTLMKQLTDLKKKSRMTLAMSERAELEKKTKGDAHFFPSKQWSEAIGSFYVLSSQQSCFCESIGINKFIDL